MSYAIAAPLQAAVYAALTSDSAVTAIVGTDVFDAIPTGAVPPLYVALGPETAKDASDKTGAGARHEFTVSVVTESAGFQSAKELAGAITDALVHETLTLSRGRLVYLHFLKAKAARVDSGLKRQIDLTFRARVEDD